jgi:hypothetical protein
VTPDAFAAAARAGSAPPDGLSPALLGLWWDRRGDWTRAHEAVAADEVGRDAAWVHAYLHRREGDAANARYWYRRAARPEAVGGPEEEWGEIAAVLLG